MLTDCFDVHTGPGECERLVYGYELPDATEPPSTRSIRRAHGGAQRHRHVTMNTF